MNYRVELGCMGSITLRIYWEMFQVSAYLIRFAKRW